VLCTSERSLFRFAAVFRAAARREQRGSAWDPGSSGVETATNVTQYCLTQEIQLGEVPPGNPNPPGRYTPLVHHDRSAIVSRFPARLRTRTHSLRCLTRARHGQNARLRGQNSLNFDSTANIPIMKPRDDNISEGETLSFFHYFQYDVRYSRLELAKFSKFLNDL
jgi:hypothetical protein